MTQVIEQNTELRQPVPNLTGRVALITGAGQGLGWALSESLAEAGAIIIAADLVPERAANVIDHIRLRGAEGMSVELDVADEERAAMVVSDVLSRYGRLDVLINNAGTDRTVSIDDLTFDEWDRIQRTNLRGPFVLSKLALPVMKKQGAGHIVNIISTAAKRAWANAAGYHSSKWGLLGFTYALHVEARPHKVKVTAVIAGGMRTPFLLDRFPDLDPGLLQDPRNVADSVRFVLTQPAETVIPELMVIPMRETSWP
jgi:NAD(P)-dependent dehydrogenase (short-subunit alcohol dehydrogenase family)